jgi:hypothetical protein
MLVRFVAACCLGLSLVEFVLAWAEFTYRSVPVNFFLLALWIVLFLAGVAILVKAKAIAEWISDWLE